ncbi:hypothetical protein HD554DRAFT_505611 [Boletus coccyginus]|nr:hypothetical protein HD554DRAFT_505611 [Boletus coccyginus]
MPWGCLAQNIVMSGVVIRDLTIKYLDLSLPLSRQPDKLLVEEVIIKAQSMCPVLQQYEGGWATRDLMGQFLRNTTAYDRRREKAIKHESIKNRKEQAHSDSESEDSDLDNRRAVRQSSKSKKRSARYLDTSDSDSESGSYSKASIKAAQSHRGVRV